MSWKIESPHDQMLHLAALKGDLGKIRDILDSGRVYIDVQDAEGTTPLLIAVANNYLSCAKELLEQGANVNARRKTTGSTCLHYAAQFGLLDMARMLMDYKAQLDVTCNHGSTPLLVACQNNQLPVVEYLHENGASLHVHMTCGATALFLAAQEGHFRMIKFLIRKGANIDESRLDGTSPMWIASQMGHTEIIAQLIYAGAKADLPRKDGATPLFKACQKGHFEIVELLLRQAPQLDLLRNGYSALHAAAFNDHKDIAQVLLYHGADPCLRDRDGLTPADLARKRGHLKLAQLIASWKRLERPTSFSSGQTESDEIDDSSTSRSSSA